MIPGQKVCITCKKEIFKLISPDEFMGVRDNNDSEEEFVTKDKEPQRSILNDSLCELDISPLKVHSLPQHSKIVKGKKKLIQVQEKLGDSQVKIKQQIATALNTSVDDLQLPEKADTLDRDLGKKASDFDYLINQMKEKIALVSNKREKVRILTLAPRSWTIDKTSKVFGVSHYLVRLSRKIVMEKGILEVPDPRRGTKILSVAVKNQVKSFYLDDEFSRQLPGKRDFVSVKRNVHEQKKLLLSNLKELFSEFGKRNPNVKVGFSSFCMLRPKCCCLVGQSGTHSVCVCTEHQNIKLMLEAIKIEKSYHDLIEKIVCDRESKICMLHRC